MKLLIGGSPCTHWSIAQTKNRETQPKGLGWELFRNYLIAREKFKPDYFLYENNKSMSLAIREQITKELGVEPILINSALVSAQNRQRLYWTNIPSVELPEDRSILLRDILETNMPLHEKTYTLKAQHCKNDIAKFRTNDEHYDTCVAEPVRVGTIESAAKNSDFDSQQYRVYSPDGKSVTICGQGGGIGAKTGLYAVPYCIASRGRYTGQNGKVEQHLEVRTDEKTNALTTVQKDNMVVEPAKEKCFPVYNVQNGLITVKDRQYPIKLRDGLYIIRKLTVTECKRLQTVPDDYIFPVSNSQAYKMLGNGWTVDVIAHILSYCPGITTEPLEVLSMYDGMSCGRLALQKLGGGKYVGIFQLKLTNMLLRLHSIISLIQSNLEMLFK